MTEEIFANWTEDDPIGPEETPPENWQEFDENIETTHECPRCGYNFTPPSLASS